MFFYIGWGAWIYSSHNQNYLNPFLITLAGVGIHLFSQSQRLKEIGFMLLVVALAVGLEFAYLLVPLFEYSPDVIYPPIWIIGIYTVYSTSVGSCLGYLRGRWFLMSFLGAVGGSLSYASGIFFSSANFGVDRYLVLCIIGVVWALFLPLCFWLRGVIYQKI